MSVADRRRAAIAALLLVGLALAACSAPEPAPSTRGDASLDADPAALAVLRDAAAKIKRGGVDAQSGIRLLEELYTRFPASKRLRNVLDGAYLGRNNWEAAVGLFDGVDRAAMSADEKRHLGRLYFKAGRFEESAALLVPLAEIDPADAELASTAARALYNQGKHDAALAVLERSWPDLDVAEDREALRVGGLIRFEKGETERAIALLNRAVSIAPDYATGHYTLARVLAQSGAADEAEEHLETFRRLSQEEAREHTRRLTLTYRMMEIHLAMMAGETRDAEKMIREILPDAPDATKADLFGVLAQIYAATGRAEAAERVRREQARLRAQITGSQ